MATQADDKTLYERDFYLWIQETANLLKTQQLDQLDYENLIDEVESLGFMERANLRDNLRTLLRSLLKWKYLPPQDNNDWSSTALQACFELQDILEVSPSLNAYFDEVLEETYQIARKLASIETESDIFPATTPFKKEEILNDDYYCPEEN
jgi:hypothetical protein